MFGLSRSLFYVPCTEEKVLVVVFFCNGGKGIMELFESEYFPNMLQMYYLSSQGIININDSRECYNGK